MNRQQIIDFYTTKHSYLEEKINTQKKTLLQLSLLRLFFFLLSILFIFAIANKNIAIAFSITSLILFIVSISIHSKKSKNQKYSIKLRDICSKEINILQGNSDNLNEGKEYITKDHAFENDLDIFGESSLFAFINRTKTYQGKNTLASWLKYPNLSSEEIYLRQETLKELSADPNFILDFITKGSFVGENGDEYNKLDTWLNNDRTLKHRRLSLIAIIAIPSITLITLILSIFSIIPPPIFFIIFLGQLGYASFTNKKTSFIHSQLEKSKSYLLKYSELISSIEKSNFKAPELQNIVGTFSNSEMCVSKELSKLSILIKRFDYRLNFVLMPFLQGILLWDLTILFQLEKWKRRNAMPFKIWLKSLSKFDALISFGLWAYNNPEFTYPTIDNTSLINTKDIKHPLIYACVPNSFTLEHNKLCIITGANMAGKSTFLRSIGVNHLLALLGSPVAAEEYKFSPSPIFSSMRTADSLAKGESYFHAELNRLKQLQEFCITNKPLIILDEILKGTNSKDKLDGSIMFLKKLIKNGLTGIIATHDLDLCKLENDFPDNVYNLCFNVVIDKGNIIFDYKLNKGVTTTMNAVMLMKQWNLV